MPNSIKAIFIAFTLMFNLYGYTDLGTYGNLYEISEPDLMQIIKKSYKDFNKSRLYNEFKKSLNSYMKVNFAIPQCKKDINTFFDPTIVLKHDINMPKYNIHIKKGTKFNPLKYASLNKYLMFIDGTDKYQLEIAKKYASRAFVIVVKGNVEQVSKYIGVQAYKADKVLLKAFKVQCVPTIFIQRNYKYQKLEISFKNKDEK